MFAWLKRFFDKAWVKDLFKRIVDSIWNMLIDVGKESLIAIKDKIVEVSQLDISNENKFKKVVEFVKELLPELRDSAVNRLIEILVGELKDKGII